MTIPMVRYATLALLLSLSLGAGTCRAVDTSSAVEEGTRLYEMGDYEAALPLLEEGVAGGMEKGDLFYRLAYLYGASGLSEQARAYREKAVPLLALEIQSDEASLETFYYLSASYANLGNTREMRKTAETGVARFAEAKTLSGADWFRLGRLHQFLGNSVQKDLAFEKSVQAFSKETESLPVLHALALVADGNSDLVARRYATALEKFKKAREVHDAAPVAPFQAALAHLGAGDLLKAAEEFETVRAEAVSIEAQYGADVARRLAEAGGPLDKLPGGDQLRDLESADLETAVQEAARTLRAIVQDQESGKEVGETRKQAERVFFSLIAEQMLRGTSIREPSLSGGYADLIRRR